jgi:hypothetical protein
MLHDHGLAASTLRLLQSDYKADKAFRHYAGAQVRNHEQTILVLFERECRQR